LGVLTPLLPVYICITKYLQCMESCNEKCPVQKIRFILQAKKKGASATEHGLVFGAYELTSFIASPFIGKLVNKYFNSLEL